MHFRSPSIRKSRVESEWENSLLEFRLSWKSRMPDQGQPNFNFSTIFGIIPISYFFHQCCKKIAKKKKL